MFVYRHRQLADDLARQRELAAAPMRIAITGASGLIGTALTAFLTTAGHEVVRLVRREAGAGERRWDPAAPAPDLLAGVDAVVHLAGASIFGRHGAEHRRSIRTSRIGPTRALAELAAACGVRAFVSASGIGGYGADRGDEPLTEGSGAGEGFLADVVAEWEAEGRAAADGFGKAADILEPRADLLAVKVYRRPADRDHIQRCRFATHPAVLQSARTKYMFGSPVNLARAAAPI